MRCIFIPTSQPCGNVPAAEAAWLRQEATRAWWSDHYAAYNFARFPAIGIQRWTPIWWLPGARRPGAGADGSPGAGAAAGRGGKDRGAAWTPCGIPSTNTWSGVTRAAPALPRCSLDEKRRYWRTLGWFVANPTLPQRHEALPAAYLDGVEVMNGNPRHNSHNEDAASFCRTNGLVGLSGSDFHEWEDLAIGGLDFAGPVPDGATLVARLRAGEFVRICAQKGDA
ncbi:MAG: PHP-associated domain-containing protein [[Clostridium] leptum]